MALPLFSVSIDVLLLISRFSQGKQHDLPIGMKHTHKHYNCNALPSIDALILSKASAPPSTLAWGSVFQGERGVKGVIGLSVFQGERGVKGVIGLSVFQGERGVKGVIGLSVFQGESGVKGVTGLSVFQGERGVKGVTGLSVFQGEREE